MDDRVLSAYRAAEAARGDLIRAENESSLEQHKARLVDLAIEWHSVDFGDLNKVFDFAFEYRDLLRIYARVLDMPEFKAAVQERAPGFSPRPLEFRVPTDDAAIFVASGDAAMVAVTRFSTS